jgi:hypothetical protein
MGDKIFRKHLGVIARSVCLLSHSLASTTDPATLTTSWTTSAMAMVMLLLEQPFQYMVKYASVSMIFLSVINPLTNDLINNLT